MRCAECGQPVPADPEASLHLEDCPHHDEETCLACKEIQHGDGEVAA